MDLELLRGIERLLIVIIAGLSIYLGYGLFINIPKTSDRSDSKGKLELPGGISIFVSRIGPGVFFALFGAVVVGLSLHYQVKTGITDKTIIQTADGMESREFTRYSSQFGQSATSVNPQELQQARLRIGGQIAFLNRLPGLTSSTLTQTKQDNLITDIREIKLELLDKVWGDWGDPRVFKDWARRGAGDPPPKGLEPAAALYRQGLQEASP